MVETVDYYFTLNSPWSYLGHGRFTELSKAFGVAVRVHPVDFGTIFPATGGLPLPKRSPERQAYRLQELDRWPKILGVPINVQPDYWPVDETLAAGMVRAAEESGAGGLELAGALLRAVWAENRDIADGDTLLAIAADCGLDGAGLMEEAGTEAMAERRAADSRDAIERGVFGAPTYIVDGQLFWGQDRLDMLKRVLEGSL
jgi:carboxymethylenebutenolidase